MATNTKSGYVIFFYFADNESYTNAPETYGLRALLVMVILNFSGNSLFQKQ
jgi:hypothetical protein